MADIRTDVNYLDLYTINADYIGSRQVMNDEETVDFHDASTMRIWFNEQSDNYRQHWHTAIEIIMPVENYYDAKITIPCIMLCRVRYFSFRREKFTN